MLLTISSLTGAQHPQVRHSLCISIPADSLISHIVWLSLQGFTYKFPSILQLAYPFKERFALKEVNNNKYSGILKVPGSNSDMCCGLYHVWVFIFYSTWGLWTLFFLREIHLTLVAAICTCRRLWYPTMEAHNDWQSSQWGYCLFLCNNSSCLPESMYCQCPVCGHWSGQESWKNTLLASHKCS